MSNILISFLVAALGVSFPATDKHSSRLHLASGAPGSYVKLSKSQSKNFRAMLEYRLKDPYSAKFGPMTVKKFGENHYTICGTINAKNGFGAYSGHMFFYSAFIMNGSSILEDTFSFHYGDSVADAMRKFC